MSTPSTSNGAEPLPRRSRAQEASSGSDTPNQALWPVRSPSPSPSSLRAVEDILRKHQNGDPLATKCGAEGGVCCKDLKGFVPSLLFYFLSSLLCDFFFGLVGDVLMNGEGSSLGLCRKTLTDRLNPSICFACDFVERTRER